MFDLFLIRMADAKTIIDYTPVRDEHLFEIPSVLLNSLSVNF